MTIAMKGDVAGTTQYRCATLGEMTEIAGSIGMRCAPNEARKYLGHRRFWKIADQSDLTRRRSPIFNAQARNPRWVEPVQRCGAPRAAARKHRLPQLGAEAC